MDPKKLATEIVNVLRHNQDLPLEDKILAVEIRLQQYANYIQDHALENTIQSTDYARDIPELANIMLANPRDRGPSN